MQTSGKGILRSAALAALLVTFLFTVAFADTSILGPGSKGDAVKTLQQELQEKGYYTAKVITSTYTSALKNAVGVFQIANSIKPEKAYGYADEPTQKLAASDEAVLYADYIEKVQDKQLQPGGSGTYVKKAQSKLKSLGYYGGSVNGKYGASTTAAVKYFQTANSPLTVSGSADSATRTALYSADPAPVTRAQYEAAHFLTPITIGAKGDQVTQLQTRLAALGYYWGDPSGVYDVQTKYCVRFFQEANGFSVNGAASKAVREKANTDSSVSFATYTKNMQLLQLSSSAKPGVKIAVLQLKLKELGYYTGIVTGIYNAPVITAVRTFQIFNNMSSKYVTGKANTETRKLLLSASALTFGAVCGDNTLRPGDKGSAVSSMQSRLTTLEYYKGSADGQYDGDVTSAVKLFQKFNNLYPSGIAYTQTLTLLESDSAVSYYNARIEKLIDVAEDKLGTPYGTGKGEFDCSAFTAYCLRQVGVSVTAEVQAQGRSSIGRRITITDNKNYKELKRGDLLYFWSPDHKKKPGHAAIYLGSNKFIHASSGAGKVTVSSFKSYNERDGGPWFLWAIRIWE
jgi:peptidoglycan hydrolase-like protein with peptidoglycan-binding domain